MNHRLRHARRRHQIDDDARIGLAREIVAADVAARAVDLLERLAEERLRLPTAVDQRAVDVERSNFKRRARSRRSMTAPVRVFLLGEEGRDAAPAVGGGRRRRVGLRRGAEALVERQARRLLQQQPLGARDRLRARLAERISAAEPLSGRRELGLRHDPSARPSATRSAETKSGFSRRLRAGRCRAPASADRWRRSRRRSRCAPRCRNRASSAATTKSQVVGERPQPPAT